MRSGTPAFRSSTGARWRPRSTTRRRWRPDGTVIFRQRYFGDLLRAAWTSTIFPFDRQRFHIQLVVPGYGPDEVALVPAPDGPSRRQAEHDPFSVADWDIGDVEAYPEPYPGDRGRSRDQRLPGRCRWAGAILGFWAGKAFVSVAIIVAMSWLVFWIDPKFVAPRLSVTVTSMLTLIAYRFLLDGSLPELSYLTRMDYFPHRVDPAGVDHHHPGRHHHPRRRPRSRSQGPADQPSTRGGSSR